MWHSHPGSSGSGDPAERLVGQGPAWEGTTPLGVEEDSVPSWNDAEQWGEA